MATYRYWDIRRDIYEQCSNKSMKKYRSFADMKRLFKTCYWILLIGMILCLIIYIILFFVFPNKVYRLIPVGCAFILEIISEFFGEKMYNPTERKKELNENSTNLEQYIENINNIMKKHNITTKEQREILKKECERQLSLHIKNYRFVSNRVFDMLVGVPLGAFISALIYKSDSADILVEQLITIIIMGLIIVGAINSFKKITYYSNGHFKDQHLLDVLNELEYLSE